MRSSSRRNAAARRFLWLSAASAAALTATGAYADTAIATVDAPVATAPETPTATTRLNPTGRDITLTSPLRNGQFVLGDIDFVLHADDTVTVNAPRLLELLRPILASDKFAALQTVLAGRGQVDVTELRAAGYPVTYDPASISLSIDIPAQSRVARQLQIADLDNDVIGSVAEPARLAGYVNFRAGQDYVWTGANQGADDLIVLMDTAVRYRGVVFETEGSYLSGTNSPWRREGSRFIYDDVRRAQRWTLGDLKPVSRGFSGAAPMTGVSVFRSYAILQPQRNVQPRGDQTFTLSRPSTVEAFINGQSVRQVRLDPGTYNVSDFPFAQGANDVQLVITDDAGTRETISFSLFFDRTLLAPGLSEYALYVGIQSPATQSDRDYRTNDWIASGFYRRGVSEQITAGLNFQIQRDGGIAGGELVWASTLGTFGLDAAYSHNDFIGDGYALNASFQRVFNQGQLNSRSFALTFDTRSRDFANPGAITVNNRFAFEVGATYAQGLGEFQFISFDARHSQGRDGNPNEENFRVNYGLRLSARTNITVQGSYVDRPGQENEFGLRVALRFRLSERTSISADYDTQNEQGRLGIQTSRGQGVGAWSASADITGTSEAVALNGNFNQTLNRAEYGVSHVSAFDIGNGESIDDQRTSLRFGTAIAFADGHVALSRPIYDSFALVTPHRTLGGRRVIVEPQEAGYNSRSGPLGPAAMPDLTSYSERAVTFDVPDAPPGYDLGAGAFRVVPPYRAGYLVVVGSDYSVTAIGRLLDRDGEPIRLLAGQAFEVGNASRPPVTLFTNRDGRFGVGGLRPGRWRIEMPTEPRAVYFITIPESSEGVVRLPDQRPESSSP